MPAVADTSPLNYLVWVGLSEVLPELYGAAVIPPEVRSELLAVDAPSVVRDWAADLPDWISIRAPDPILRDDLRWAGLDRGERSAIALATMLSSSVLLIDERAGSAIARGLGLPAIGTLGVLDEASRRKLISLPYAIDRLKRTSFRYPKAVVELLLKEDSARSR
jgi:predicted nucleic acid-binding protein